MGKKIVVFDVGGVLIELHFQRMYDALAEFVKRDPSAVRRAYDRSGLEKRFSNDMKEQDYFQAIRELYRIGASDRQLRHIRSIALGAPIAEMVDLKAMLMEKGYAVGILSIHDETAERDIRRRCPEIFDATTHVLLSHRTRQLKPDIRAYEPFGEGAVFIDDKMDYINPPVQHLGWHGIWYTEHADPTEAIRAEQRYGDGFCQDGIIHAASVQGVRAALRQYGVAA